MATPKMPERCLRLAEVQQLAPYTKFHFYRMEKAGQFPARIKLSGGRVVWRMSEVMAWLKDKQAGQKAA